MHQRTTPNVFGHAKQLHRNMTPAEVKLWARLRAHRLEGVHFRNHTCPPTPLTCTATSTQCRRKCRFGDNNGGRCQGHAIGNYVVDFCAPRKQLIIELDGSQHLEQDAAQYDKERTEYLESKGYTVLRFWNNSVMNDIESVIRAIMQAMESEHHLQKEP